MTTLNTLNFILALISTAAGISTNPVNLSILLVFLSALIFFLVNLITSSLWFPLVFFLVFMGGILIMFIILSSTLPNEKSNKVNISIITLSASLPLLLASSPIGQQELFYKEAKGIVTSNQTTLALTLLIIMYFSVSIYMVSNEEVPLRSLENCY